MKKKVFIALVTVMCAMPISILAEAEEWATSVDWKLSYCVDAPVSWGGGYTTGVFGPGNRWPGDQWVILSHNKATTPIEKLINFAPQFDDDPHEDKREDFILNGKEAIKLTRTVWHENGDLYWKSDQIIIIDDDRYFEISDGAIPEPRFDRFYKSFKLFDEKPLYDDICPTDGQYTSVKYLTENKIIKGYGDDSPSYRPNKPINRAEFTKIVVGAMNLDLSEEQKNCFPDVQEQWFAEYVCKAKELGIIAGYPDGEFKPGENVNIAEAAKIVAEAFRIESGERRAKNDEWYEKYISALKDVGALEFEHSDVGRKLTRGGMAEIIWKVLLHSTKES